MFNVISVFYNAFRFVLRYFLILGKNVLIQKRKFIKQTIR